MLDNDFIKDLGDEYPNREEINEVEFNEVYAGPEYFINQGNTVSDIEDEEAEEKKPRTMLIYGGPLMFNKNRPVLGKKPSQSSEDEDITPMACVYAGPEYFEALKNKNSDTNTKICKNCGASFSSSLEYCPECGTKSTKDSEVTKA